MEVKTRGAGTVKAGYCGYNPQVNNGTKTDYHTCCKTTQNTASPDNPKKDNRENSKIKLRLLGGDAFCVIRGLQK